VHPSPLEGQETLTSRRKRAKAAQVIQQPADIDPRAEKLRRALLGLLTALIVARPLVLGEDPGMTSPLSNASGLLLSVLWFIAAVGWGVWRAWSRQLSWRGSAVEAALLVVVALVFFSVPGVTRYKHAGTLVACEWLILLLAFCLVRQLARSREDNQALLAAIVATGLSLAIYAIYQYGIELPALRAKFASNTEALKQALGVEGTLDETTLDHLRRRILEDNVFATYAHPNSFAGYIVLLFPCAVGYALVCWRRWPWGWRALCTSGFVLLFAAALWLTHSRGAILATLAVGLVVLLIQGWLFLWRHKPWLLGGLLVLIGAGLLAARTDWGTAGLTKGVRSAGLRTGYWSATWNMIREQPFRGVGPGNFGRRYPHYMFASAFEKVQDPHNFVLEVWATSGLFALAALLAALALFFLRTWIALRRRLIEPPVENQTDNDAGFRICWEFYLGGMAGLLLGFLLRAIDEPASDILMEGFLSAGRSLIWFAAFTLLNTIPWPGRGRLLALAAGVAALLLNLLVSGGIALPSVAQPLWIVAALALNVPQEDSSPLKRPRPWFESMVPLPLLAGASVAYLVLVFYPVVSGTAALAEARGYAAQWQKTIAPLLIQRPPDAKPTPQEQALLVRSFEYLKGHVLKPLEEAIRQDPGDVTPRLELANWYLEMAMLFPANNQFFKLARDQIAAVQNLDPYNKEGYLVLNRLYVKAAERTKSQEASEYVRAATALEKAVELDPTEARLRYQAAEAWFRAGDPVQGRRQAAAAVEYDLSSAVPERKLGEQRQKQIQLWLEKPVSK